MADSPFRTPSQGIPVPLSSYNTGRALTAAAVRIRMDDKSEAEQFKLRRSSSVAAWQSEAWEYFDAISEIKYAFYLVANVVSRIRLYAAVVEDPSEPPVDVKDSPNLDPEIAAMAQRGLKRLDSAFGGQSGLLRDAAMNLSVAGECYLVQVPARPSEGLDESWDIRSVDELRVDSQDNYIITPRRELVGGSSSKKGVIKLPKKSFTGRIWRSHPRFSDEPDSSLKGLLDLCAELLLLDRTFRATHRSRLNAGAMFIPDGFSVAANPDPTLYDDETSPDTTEEEQQDEFEDNLIEAMTTPVEDESSAAALVPFLIRGPAELGEKIKQFKFERSFEKSMNDRADRVLDRIIQGLDVPKDVVTGLSNVKYSNAIQIDEALYKAHIEPMLLLISDALTVLYLRPYLRGLEYDEETVNRITIWFDPSAVATRNDRAADADKGFDNYAISLKAWRDSRGFSEADAPTPEEVTFRAFLDKGTFTPDFTEALFGIIAPDIADKIRQVNQANSIAPVPTAAQDILNGGTGGAPATPGAEGDAAAPTGLAEPGAVEQQPAPESGEPVQPGDDAPPFPLAEPNQ